MTSRARSSAKLDDLAFHVGFEVVMLVEQVESYIDNYGPVFPSSSSTLAEEQSLLEASLVHLRLLDEFLSCTGNHPDDVKADDWPNWTPKGFLGPNIRKAINWQVAHLSARRTRYQWHLTRHAKDCCDLVLEFFSVIPPERLPAFDTAPAVADRGKRRFQAELATHRT